MSDNRYPFLDDDDPVQVPTARLIAGLQAWYGEVEPPPCRVCGAAMTVARSGPGGTTWACGDMSKWPSPPNYSTAHYEQSRWSSLRREDPFVVEAMERLKALAAAVSLA